LYKQLLITYMCVHTRTRAHAHTEKEGERKHFVYKKTIEVIQNLLTL